MSRPMFAHSEATAQSATRHVVVHGVSRTAEQALSPCERLSIAAPTAAVADAATSVAVLAARRSLKEFYLWLPT